MSILHPGRPRDQECQTNEYGVSPITVRGVWSGGFGGARRGQPVPVPVPVPSLGSFLQLPVACRVLAGSFMAKSALLQLSL